ncbi:MAG: NAD-dependent epimerase/dehydratase family protein [Planctomycetota bacterium]|nr:NAD-dependent epimerase/dehydratase family protein [Planctomycetota bacterium]
MNWLITGGCGFIGLRLVRYLLKKENQHIRIFDNLSVGTQEDLAKVSEFVEGFSPDSFSSTHSEKPVQLIVGDIQDETLVLQSLENIDVVVHLAANTGVGPSVEDPRTDCLTNVIGTFNLLEATHSAQVKRFVFASSGAPVGEVNPPIHEELAPHPVSPYGASKLAGEGYCSAYYRTFGLEAVALRFGNVYGPGSTHKGSVVAKFIRQAFAGETLEIYGDGTQTRDFVYVDDLIKAIWQAATVPGVGGEVFQIATNRETTLHELTELLVEELGNAGVKDVLVRHASSRLGDVQHNFSDTTKALTVLGWQANTSLKNGVRNTIRFFQKGVDE